MRKFACDVSRVTARFLWKVLPLLLACAAPLVSHAGQNAIDKSALTAFPCPGVELSTYLVSDDIEAFCGYLNVTERADGTGRAIKLAIVVLTPVDEALAAKPPTVLIHGGPGYGIVDAWWYMATQGFAQGAPVVLFDHRGVGSSTPKLCEDQFGDSPELDQLSPIASRQQALDELAICLDELQEQGTDLASYGTHATVRDMESIRTTLKIDSWNVYGISYGTTVALAYLKAHPQRVRATIVDSLYPPEMPGFTSSTPDFMRALSRLNDMCASQPRCAKRFGDLVMMFERALTSLEVKPLAIHVQEDFGNAVTIRHISPASFMAMVQTSLLDSEVWHLVPLLIDDVVSRRDGGLLSQMFQLYALTTTGTDVGVYLATECRERSPFDDRRALIAQSSKWPLASRAMDTETLFALCESWPSKLAQNWETPREVSTPVLVVGGMLDPVTPPLQATETAKRLGSRAQLLLVPNTSHNPTSGNACMEQIVVAFLTAPDRQVNTLCAQFRPAPALATRLIELRLLSAIKELISGEDAPLLRLIAIGITLGWLSALLWPLGRVWALLRSQSAVTHDPFLLRSSFLFSLAALVFAGWGASSGAFTSESAAASAIAFGVPANSWPSFSLILVVVLLAITGTWAVAGEVGRRRVGALWLFHRVWVILSMFTTFFFLWQADLFPNSLEHVADDARALFENARSLMESFTRSMSWRIGGMGAVLGS